MLSWVFGWVEGSLGGSGAAVAMDGLAAATIRVVSTAEATATSTFDAVFCFVF